MKDLIKLIGIILGVLAMLLVFIFSLLAEMGIRWIF
jgi:hypothetical protein